MTASLSEEQQKALLGQIPLGHLGKPADIAHAVAYLASPGASYVTGQELHVGALLFEVCGAEQIGQSLLRFASIFVFFSFSQISNRRSASSCVKAFFFTPFNKWFLYTRPV